MNRFKKFWNETMPTIFLIVFAIGLVALLVLTNDGAGDFSIEDTWRR